MRFHPLMTLGAVLATAAFPACAQPQAGFGGRWITESGNLEVEIAPCGDAWCGTVTRQLGNRAMSMKGQEMDAADKRPVLGMRILTGLKPSGDDATLGGEIYNRENAKTYSVRLTLDGAQQLLVRPYIVLPLFGKTQVWHRAPERTPPKADPKDASVPEHGLPSSSREST